MEPLTAIAVIATKYGVASLIGALTGEKGLGELVAELVGALSTSEDRLGERLAGIERRLDEVLEQRYTTAVGTGLRTLLDAGTTADRHVRADELVRARDLFREAGASARSTLQVAVAERYLALCAVALGRTDAARTALRRLNGAALEALLESGQTAGFATARQHAVAQLEQSGWSGSQRRRGERISELIVSVQHAAAEAGELAGHLLREAGVLTEGLGDGKLPRLRKLPAPRQYSVLVAPPGAGRWEIRPRGSAPVRFGPLSVKWHSVRRRPRPEQDRPARNWPTQFPSVRPQRRPSTLSGQPPALGYLFSAQPSTPAAMLDVVVTIRTDPVLSQPLGLTLVGSGVPAGSVTGRLGLRRASWTLPAGERELRIRHSLPAGDQSLVCILNVSGMLLFRSR